VSQGIGQTSALKALKKKEEARDSLRGLAKKKREEVKKARKKELDDCRYAIWRT